MRNTYFFFVYSIFSFIFPSFLVAQEQASLNGQITDSSGEPIIGANVLVEKLQKGAVTDFDGNYSLKLPQGEHEISFSILGYKTVTQTVNLTGDQRLNISMEESAEQLDDIVITENVERVDIKDPQMSVNTLSISTIKQMPVVMGETDIIKSMLLLPGVTSGGEGSSGFNVRGGAADQNLILLDQSTLYSSSHLFGFFSIFNPDAIKDLKLYKGGIPASYGGRVSSVLDISQKTGNMEKFQATGGIGIVSSRLVLEGPMAKEKSSFLVAGRSSYAHIFLPLFDNDNVGYFYDLNARLSHRFNDNNSLYFSGYFGRDVFKVPGSFGNNFGSSSANLRWNHIFSEDLFSDLNLSLSDYYYGLDLDFIGFNFEIGIRNYNLKYDFTHYVSNGFQLTYGINSIYYNFNPGEIKPIGEDSGINPLKLTEKYAFENAAYIGSEIDVTDKLSVQAGLRVSSFHRLGQEEYYVYENGNPVLFNEQLSIYEKATPIDTIRISRSSVMDEFFNLEPRISAAYELNEDSSIKGSYNRLTQYIHLISNTNSPTPVDIYAPSGEYIKPQLANLFALGYFRNLNRYSLEVESFYKTVDNRVDYVNGANLIGNNAIERVILSGESRAYGLEILFKKNEGKFQGWIAYTLSRSEQRTPGRTAEETGINNGNWYLNPWDKTHDLSITSNYHLNDKWKFGASFILQTGQPVTFPNGQYEYNYINIPIYEDRNESRLPAFHHLDLSATLTPSKNKNRRWQGEWVFSIYNVYNRRNAASITFRENMDVGRNEAVRLSIFGFVPAVTYNFKF